MAGFSSTPSNYPFLKKLRAAKKATLKPCPYIKTTTVLRDYQVIGVLHFLSLARMVLGDGVGLGKCVSLNTYINTSKGMKKLEKFIPKNPKEDTLYPYTGTDKLLTLKGPVKPDAVYYCGVTRGLKIKTQKGYELSGLRRHPIFAPLNDSLGYQRLDSFIKDDYICINRKGVFPKNYVKIKFIQKSSLTIPELLKEDLAELLGFYISRAQISELPPINETVHNRIKELSKKVFGYEQKDIDDTEILSILKRFGLKAPDESEHQMVPKKILCSPESVVASFMEGYFEGSGAVVNKTGKVYYYSKSEELTNQLQLLLLGLGVISKRIARTVLIGETIQPQYILSHNRRDFRTIVQDKKRKYRFDVIPMGRALLENTLYDIYAYIKKVSELKSYAVKGMGWRNVIEGHIKRLTDGVVFYDKNLTYGLLDSIIEAIDMHNLQNIVSNYPILKLLQDQKFYFDTIASIKPTRDTFADFHVPVEHNFMGNGFVNHNTLQMITSFAYRLMSEPNLKLIVVTPKSAMAQWAEEFEKFCTGIKVHILTNEYGEVREKGPDGKMVSTGEYGSLEELKARGVKHRKISGFEARKNQYDNVDAHVLIISYFAVKEDYKFIIENRSPVFQVAFDECFSYHTPITLADGTTELIGKIVTNRMPVEVLSYNFDTGLVEPRKVVNFFQNDSNVWYKVKGKKTSPVICSLNHGFYTSSGKKRADELIPGDIIYGLTKKIDGGWDKYEDVVEYSIPHEYSDKTFSKYRYNIEVEGNHNYFANNILVSNCQEFKNIKTKTWFGASEISSAAKYCYGMSATIIKNRLEEAYYIYRVIVPGLFPGKIKFFNEYTVRKKMTRWQGPRGKKGNKRYFNKIVGYKNLAQFKEIIDPFFLIRRTRDVADELPRLISRKLLLEMSDAQDLLYKKALSGELYQKLIKEKYFKFEQYASSKEELTDKEEQIYEQLRIKYDESLTKEGLEKNKIAALSYCQLVSNGPGWLGEDGESSKETEFRRLFEQELSDEKVIVFTRFKSGIKRLSAILNDLGLKYVQITGDNTIDERRDARKMFQDMDKDCNVIFITQAGSAAINLQAAGVILYYDTPWSYGDLYQSIGRAQRIGSIREHILLLHMVNVKTIDEHVLGILDGKKDLINQIVGDIAEGALAFKDDEIMFGDEESSVSALFNSVFK